MSRRRNKLTLRANWRYSVAALAAVFILISLVGLRLVFRSYAAAPPPAGGYFPVSGITPPPAGTDGTKTTALPTDAQCAAEVHRSTWEPRPENNIPNHTTAPQPNTLGDFSQWNNTWNTNYKPLITGNFTGTTDEIIQWVACKWGWSDELVRAEAVAESNWYQATAQNQGFGDYEPRSNGHCVFDFSGDPCPTSYSIIQVKWYFHPAGFASNSPGSSYPWITKSTAYALDLQVAEMRGCYDGMSTYLTANPGGTAGDLWGCIQDWFSGGWFAGGGNQSYSNSVKTLLTSRPWATWADQGGGTTKTGDINGDGSVNISDLSILAAHYGGSGGLAQGDLNADGKINISDLSILAAHWGT